MNYFEFEKLVKDYPLFETRELKLILGEKLNRAFLNNLKNWERKGYLVKLKKGLFLLENARFEIDPFVAASKIYSPSYVSLETALSFYGIIPEAVFTVTSVTSRKTRSFSNKLGKFTYQKIKKDAFLGHVTKKKGNISYSFALPEKALVDFCYLNRHVINGTLTGFESYRFSKEFKYSKNKLLMFSKSFNNKKLKFLINNFIRYYATR